MPNRRDNRKVKCDDVVLSELEPTSKHLCLLDAFELAVAEQTRVPGDADETVSELETGAPRYNAEILSILGSIHRLRLQSSGTQDNLQAEREVSSSLQGSRFYAVLIGIDEYASSPLQGCISDVRLMENYLTERLRVPADRIRRLLGSKEHSSPGHSMHPSRANIVNALLSINNHPDIVHGNNIIIFYASHGSSYSFEREGDTLKHIEALCPIDRDTIGEDGKSVPDISDREFNTILTQISRVKGDHITVILDCCHSGSVSRGVGVRTVSRTSHTTVEDMLLVGEQTFGSYPGYRSILSKDWHSDMDSHVILAACKADQFAMAKVVEGKDRDGVELYNGIFTDSLVRALQSDYYTRGTTYADLIGSLAYTPSQTPVVAGKRKDARVWYQE
ncbi:caspase domain-containing protein [Armillaria novae-zelandiae]|uniref:Caspase domain-containing protein n=1 Tax=Armillaria novae-zelandiae TaxID=153914 RepID=A0AA39NNJ3_9AGAR|nr:caspase domain-containing protein [Armillaria novae-zelandiae]